MLSFKNVAALLVLAMCCILGKGSRPEAETASNVRSRRLDQVWEFRIKIVYGFKKYVYPHPTSSELIGVTRLTDIYFVRLLAAKYGQTYRDFDLAYFRHFPDDKYKLAVEFTGKATIEDLNPLPDKILDALISGPSDIYVDSFVNSAEPLGLFKQATSASFSASLLTATPSPTASPTKAPSPAPPPGATPAPVPATPMPTSTDDDDVNICFSGETTVQVKHKGTVLMKDLQVGDSINIGNGKYSRVYGFGHLDTANSYQYVVVHTSSKDKGLELNSLPALELSGRHLIFTKGSNGVSTLKQAAHLKVNDILYGEKGVEYIVSKIQKVNRVGAYLPLTPEGTITVNGLLASTYVSIYDEAPRTIQLLSKVVDDQQLFGLFVTPFRVICRDITSAFCTSDNMYDQETGIWNWLLWGQDRARSANEYNTFWQTASILAALVVLASFKMAELVWDNSYAIGLLLVLHRAYGAFAKESTTVEFRMTPNKKTL